MYQGIKSIIFVNNKKSPLFPCSNGVRQGERLSPIVFSLYLNNLEHYLLNHGFEGVSSIPDNKILEETSFAYCMLTILLR